MRFTNLGESMKIRQGNKTGYKWITLKNGEEIDLPTEVGRNKGLKELEVTTSKIGPTIVETKQFSFKDELTEIKGVGSKTVKDILRHYPTKENLINNLDNLGLRDDIELKLREKYGK